MRILILGNGSRWEKEFVEYALLPISCDIIVYGSKERDTYRSFYESNRIKYIPHQDAGSLLMKIPKLRAEAMLHQQIRTLKKFMPFDVIINMFVNNNGLRCANTLRSKNTQVIAYFCGSDILRVENIKLLFLRHNLRKVNQVIFESESVEQGYQRKIKAHKFVTTELIHLGITVFEKIDGLRQNKEEIKLEFGIPKAAKTVCVGYNGNPAQQHLEVIKQINLLPKEEKEDIYLILPMTYGSSLEYIELVSNAAHSTGCNHLVLKSFMNNETMAKLHCLTDIFINAQITDGLSASVLESIYAGATLLNASWLVYPEFKKWNISYVAFESIGDLPDKILSVLHRDVRRNIETNHAILGTKMSWKTTASQWGKILDRREGSL